MIVLKEKLYQKNQAGKDRQIREVAEVSNLDQFTALFAAQGQKIESWVETSGFQGAESADLQSLEAGVDKYLSVAVKSIYKIIVEYDTMKQSAMPKSTTSIYHLNDWRYGAVDFGEFWERYQRAVGAQRANPVVVMILWIVMHDFYEGTKISSANPVFRVLDKFIY